MKAVEPIRDPRKINAMKRYLKGKSVRDYALFVVGTNVALRISDLLDLTWDDILDENGNFKILILKEGKTQKIRNIKLNQSSRKAIGELLETLDTYDMDDYIFKSREGDNKPISRQQALNILKDAAESVGVKENIGTIY